MTTVTYFVDYYEDISEQNSALLGILIATNILIFFVIVFRIYYHYKHNPPAVLGPKFTQNIITHSIFYIIDEWSYIMFWVTFFVTGYWFINYKMSTRAVLLLPSTAATDSFYEKFDVIFYMMLAFRTAAVLFRIVQQSSADIYLMDWEKPRRIAIEDKDESVIAWRSHFIANEFNELQVRKRVIAPETLLIWFAFFWKGVGWGYISQTNPDFQVFEMPLQPYNMILRFFLAAFLMLVIATVQYILYLLLNISTEYPLKKFTDLCSVSNISVLIMTTPTYGYYLHGKAPWQSSDLPLTWLKKRLDEEYRGIHGQRSFGMQKEVQSQRQNSNSLHVEVSQTFEIYMTNKFKDQIQDLASKPLGEFTQRVIESEEKGEVVEGGGAVPELKLTFKQKEKERRIKAYELKKRDINQMLTRNFDKADSQANNISARTSCQRLCRQPPPEFDVLTSDLDTPFHLMKDYSMAYPSFENNLYLSLDF